MKYSLLLSCAFAAMSFVPGWAQNYPTQSTRILAQQGNFAYTEGHFAKGVRFVEFLLNTNITEAEKQAGLQEALQTFRVNPQQTIQEVETVDAQMQQVYQLTDPSQIALFRSALLCQMAVVINQSNQTFVLKELIAKYNPILAYDPQNMVAFTQKDFDGYLDYMAFQAQLIGQQYYIDAATRNQYQQQMVQYFLQGDGNVRRSMALMEIMNEYVQASYAALSPAQKQQIQMAMVNQMNQQYAMQQNPQYQNQVKPESNPYNQVDPGTGGRIDQYGNKDYTDPKNLWPEGVNTKAEKQAYLLKRQQEINTSNMYYNTMTNINTMQHVTTMNIIENMGNSGDYWELKYNNY